MGKVTCGRYVGGLHDTCQCGARKHKDSRTCKPCRQTHGRYVGGHHDTCACGARKHKDSRTCKACCRPAVRRGPDSPVWKGGRYIAGGYVMLRRPDHIRADSKGYVREHIVVAQDALGKPLPPGAQVHHVDLNRSNNAPSNLVVCQDHTYHALLHSRLAALLACGDPAKRMCIYCKRWDDVGNLTHTGEQHRHRACHNQAVREAKQKKRSA